MKQILILALFLPCVMPAIRVALEEDDYKPPEPYTFGYKVHDKDGDQWRSEQSDGLGKVEGSYGYVDNEGMRREVHYVADDDGFRANIKTNEPGMDIPNPADVIMNASPPSDYDATVYGIEAISIPEIKPAPKQYLNLNLNQEINTSPKAIDLPSEMDPKGFFKYHRFAEQTVPPIYVVDGHLQSPWFPMESASTS